MATRMMLFILLFFSFYFTADFSFLLAICFKGCLFLLLCCRHRRLQTFLPSLLFRPSSFVHSFVPSFILPDILRPMRALPSLPFRPVNHQGFFSLSLHPSYVDFFFFILQFLSFLFFRLDEQRILKLYIQPLIFHFAVAVSSSSRAKKGVKYVRII